MCLVSAVGAHRMVETMTISGTAAFSEMRILRSGMPVENPRGCHQFPTLARKTALQARPGVEEAIPVVVETGQIKGDPLPRETLLQARKAPGRRGVRALREQALEM